MASKITLPKDTTVPNHIAIIPDGNRRWARSKGLNTLEGHKRGFERAVEVARAARQMGVHTVSIWGFSTENWDRSPEEIAYLMKLYHKLVDDYMKEAMKEGVRIYHLGRQDRLPRTLIKKLENAMEKTKSNSKHVINICLDYGGHDEIIRAVQNMIKNGVSAKNVSKELFEQYLDTNKQPYPYIDLMIRSSGEQRTSGLLLWQSPYTEFYWERDHFPDFTPEKLKEAVLDFSRRRRRFGGNDAMEHFTFKPGIVAKLELDWWRLSKVPEGESVRKYILMHLKEQFGLSKDLAKEAAKLLIEALLEEKRSKWKQAGIKLRMFYELLKSELKLAFEPKLVASLELELNKSKGESEDLTRRHLAEVYRISLFQAGKAAHLRVLANSARNKGDWDSAQDYLEKYYAALKERIA